LFFKSPGVINALLAMRSGDAERGIAARQWLAAQPGLSAHDLRAVGVTYRIKTPEDSVSALTTLTRLANYNSNPPTKLVIMVDEYQRIGELKSKVMNEINSGIHTFFNENPKGLEIILSFSFGREDNVGFLLSNEVRSRAEPQTISLDVLNEVEAIEFIRDLLAQFRLTQDDRWAYPFTPEAISILVKEVRKRNAITPRRLMLYANHVLLERQYAKGIDGSNEITADELKTLLADLKLGSMDTESGESSA
jgi:hypothetical protein